MRFERLFFLMFGVSFCHRFVVLFLLILLPRHVYAPNVIHPDGDGWNDFFTLFGDRSVALIRRIQVYDRWGSCCLIRRTCQPIRRGRTGMELFGAGLLGQAYMCGWRS